jgi:hypothetical protein
MKKNTFFLDVKKNIYYYIEEKQSLNDIKEYNMKIFYDNKKPIDNNLYEF